MSKIIFSTARSVTLSSKLRSICLKVTLLKAFLLLLQPLFAQSGWSGLDEEMKKQQKALGNNVVMMLWKGDTIVYKKEMGDFNSKTQAPIASCSKWLTAALVMIFVDEGKITLDDKISKYIPEFARYGKNYITLRACLSHMTGVDDAGGFFKKILQRKKFSSLEEEVNSFAARDIRASPGDDFWYGNVGPNIAGRVLEVISKKKFDILIKQKLFTPMTMRRTSFSSTDGSAINPAGGALSTPDDYMQFLVMLLNKGKYKDKQILSEQSIKELMTVRTKPELIKYAPEAAKGYNYALGSWVVEEKGGIATSLSCPGLFGTWPVVDFCRGYASLLFVRTLLDDQKADISKSLKSIIDGQIGNTNCAN